MSIPESSRRTAGRAELGGVDTPFPPLRLAWLIWGLAAALYLAGFFHRVAPGVITSELMRDFGIGATALGNLSAFYFYTYVAMQVPTGILADRLGARPLLLWGAVFASLGGLLFAFAPSFMVAAAGRALIGASVAVAFICMLKLATYWLDARHFAMASGLALCVGMVGAIAAGAPLRLAVDAFGWQPVMTVIALSTLVLAVAVAWAVYDNPAAYGYRSHARPPSRPKRESVFSSIRRVLSYRNGWTLVLIPGGVVGPLITFAGLWGVPFLTTHHGMSTHEAATYMSALLLSWAISGPLVGAMSDRIMQRKSLYLGGTIIALLGWAVLIVVGPMPKGILLLLLVVIGLASGGMILSFAMGKETVPTHLAATNAGLINMGVMSGPMLLQPAVGWLLDRLWDGTSQDGSPLYSLQAFQLAFGAMLVWTIVSIGLLLITRETQPEGSARA
ncbi:putative MFS family arabinose efflux permease [Natronocella acetinitrilica]|uniref:Lysosomal dipeptide transporter MFSD1 n=1 Tax=Natronocella acetinitrilica TaxID=414046 RepID=A0AAE3G8H8_9GAMM|nr:MFS transporter [Natronocella acetinitrilica]MCP1675762.1 putative MFS family arabinose efflux permease [Natronocella acetinitrilica]